MKKAELLQNLKIDAASVRRRVNQTLNADLRERKLYMKHKAWKAIAIAAAVTVVLATSVFAVSPAGQEAINSIVSYFQSDKAVEMTSMEELRKYNEEVGKRVSKDGYTLTLDNIAADDNFIHVFYTIKAENIPFYEGKSWEEAAYHNRIGPQMWTECVIDGTVAGYSNHNFCDGYFVDNYTFKAANKYNIATRDVPDRVRVELYGDLQREDDKTSSILQKIFDPELAATITEEERAEVWYVAAEVDKSKVKVESITREINTKLPWMDAAVEKAVFSPFGNQLVLTTRAGSDVSRLDNFALYNEEGICLDVLNSDLCTAVDGSSRNSLEFLKADKNIRQLRFVPVKFKKHGDSQVQQHKIGTYPLVYQPSDYGKVVVTNIRIGKGQIEIDYYKDGFVLFDPGFVLMDDNGENAEPGGKLGCTLYTDVHYDTNSYTARYVYEKYDETGKPIPVEDTEKEESTNDFTTLGVFEQKYIQLDENNAVTVDLK